MVSVSPISLMFWKLNSKLVCGGYSVVSSLRSNWDEIKILSLSIMATGSFPPKRISLKGYMRTLSHHVMSPLGQHTVKRPQPDIWQMLTPFFSALKTTRQMKSYSLEVTQSLAFHYKKKKESIISQLSVDCRYQSTYVDILFECLLSSCLFRTKIPSKQPRVQIIF